LLSGKVVCGECGSKYNGMSRVAHERYPQYVSYHCARKNGSIKCKNSDIRREALELFVLDKLANHLFSDEMSDRLFKGYTMYILSRRTTALDELKIVREEIENTSNDIEKLIDLMVQTNSAAMAERLEAAEDHKRELQEREEELEHTAKGILMSKSFYTKAFKTAKKRLAAGKLEQTKEIINQFVDTVKVFKDRIVVNFNFDGTAADTTAIQTKTPQHYPVNGCPAVFMFPCNNLKIVTTNDPSGHKGHRTNPI